MKTYPSLGEHANKLRGALVVLLVDLDSLAQDLFPHEAVTVIT
jgi:hypothetical protein